MSKAVPREYGRLIRAKRIEIGASLRDIADHMGISHVFLADVETGRTASFRQERESALLEVLPNLTSEELANACNRDLVARFGRRNAVLDWRQVLVRNLRDAAGCALAWNYGSTFDLTPDEDPGCWANYRGKPAPGWEY